MKTPNKVVIVDDEQHAIFTLQSLLGNFSEIELAKTFSNPKTALEYITQNAVDLIFLDIQMPELSGFEFVRLMVERGLNIPVIFITAFDNYILDALRINAVDYLLKPISVSELKEAIDRFKKRVGNTIPSKLLDLIETQQRPKLRFNTRNGFILVFEDEIIFIKADGVYSSIKLKNGKEITVSQNLGKIAEQIQLPELIKIHRSVIVNANYIFEINKGKKQCVLAVDSVSYKLPYSGEGLKLIENYIV